MELDPKHSTALVASSLFPIGLLLFFEANSITDLSVFFRVDIRAVTRLPAEATPAQDTQEALHLNRVATQEALLLLNREAIRVLLLNRVAIRALPRPPVATEAPLAATELLNTDSPRLTRRSRLGSGLSIRTTPARSLRAN